MRLIALMLVRNEDWIIEASLDAALRWCDGAAMLLDRCTDDTAAVMHDLLMHRKKPVLVRRIDIDGQWNEMDLRQGNLTDGRSMGGTHFAIVDADEILTHNYLGDVRGWFEGLKAGQILDAPMVASWDTPFNHLVGDPVWSTAWLTLGFKDAPALTHRPAVDGYQHHNRPPYGWTGRVRQGVRDNGGVMHLQFTNQRRLRAKHVLYRMVDHLRWPGRETVEKLNWKYDQALSPKGVLRVTPKEWWGDYRSERIKFENSVPYQEAEIRRLLIEHGREAFIGLDLKGF
jgi:hypothetical protein